MDNNNENLTTNEDGTPILPDQLPISTETEKPFLKRHKVVVIAVAFAILLSAIALALFISRRGGGDTILPDTTESTTIGIIIADVTEETTEEPIEDSTVVITETEPSIEGATTEAPIVFDNKTAPPTVPPTSPPAPKITHPKPTQPATKAPQPTAPPITITPTTEKTAETSTATTEKKVWTLQDVLDGNCTMDEYIASQSTES